jgi:hypothetical protein
VCCYHSQHRLLSLEANCNAYLIPVSSVGKLPNFQATVMSVADEVPLFPESEAYSKERRSLLRDNDNEEKESYSKETLYRNFYSMSIAFSIIHGCAVTCLAYASTELGNEMGSATSGILYVGYAITSFLLAKPLVAALGEKKNSTNSASER